MTVHLRVPLLSLALGACAMEPEWTPLSNSTSGDIEEADDTSPPVDDTGDPDEPEDDTGDASDDTGDPVAVEYPPVSACEPPDETTEEETDGGLVLADAEVFLEPLVDTEYYTYLFGLGLAGGFDWNGDGESDLMMPSTAVFTGPFDETTDGSDPYFVWTNGISLYSYVSGVPDLDGDGYDEVLVDWDGDGTAAIVVMGPTAGEVEVSFLDPDPDVPAFRIIGPNHPDYHPEEMNVTRGVGDLNGDGYGDLLAGTQFDWLHGYDAARSHDSTFYSSGAAHLFYGPITADRDTEEADATVYGPHDSARLGISAAMVGDLDGDGFGDFAFGGYTEAVEEPGDFRTGVWVVHGPLSGVQSATDAADGGVFTARPSGGGDFALDASGVAPVGDADGDGLADFVIGDLYVGFNGGTGAGGSYLIVDDVTTYRERDCAHTVIGGAGVSRLGTDVTALGDLEGDGLSNWALSTGSGTTRATLAAVIVNGAPGGVRAPKDKELGQIRYLGEDDDIHMPGDQIDAAEHWLSGKPSGLWVQTTRGALLFTPEQLLDTWSK